MRRQHEAFLQRNNAKVQQCLDILLDAKLNSQLSTDEYQRRFQMLLSGDLDYQNPLYSFEVDEDETVSVIREKTTAHQVVSCESDENAEMEEYFQKLDREDRNKRAKQNPPSIDHTGEVSVFLSVRSTPNYDIVLDEFADLCVQPVMQTLYTEFDVKKPPVDIATVQPLEVALKHESRILDTIRESSKDIDCSEEDWVGLNMLDSVSSDLINDLDDDTLDKYRTPPQLVLCQEKPIKSRLFRCLGSSPFSLRKRKGSWILIDPVYGSMIDSLKSVCLHNYTRGKVHVMSGERRDDGCRSDLCICCVDSDFHYQLVLNRKRGNPQLIVVKPLEISIVSPTISICTSRD